MIGGGDVETPEAGPGRPCFTVERLVNRANRDLSNGIPVETDTSGIGFQPAATVNNYHGPVVTVTGDNAQIAWGNDTANQTQNCVQRIAPGYEELAELVTDLLANLRTFDLSEGDVVDVRNSAETVLAEVVKEEPDDGIIKRGVTMLKGLLAPVAAGVGAGVSAESAEAARTLIDALGTSLPF